MSSDTADIAQIDSSVLDNPNDANGRPPLSITIPKNNAIDGQNDRINVGDDEDLGGVKFRKNNKQNGLQTPYYPNGNRPISLHRPVSYQPSIGGQSNHSQSSIDHHTPPPSTPREKWKMTRRYFSTTTALSYSIFIVVFAAVAFIGNAATGKIYPLAEAFALTIIGIGFIYFLYLYIDIRLHIQKAKKAINEREKRQAYYEEQLSKSYYNGGPMELSNGVGNGIRPMPILPPPAPVEEVSHKYCFATGRHGEFFYLKLGAAWFCFGLLIHSILVISYQIILFTSEDKKYHKCASATTLAYDIAFPVYSIFVLFFIFKYANVIINENRGLARFCLMHAIGTSLALWIAAVVRETHDAIRLKDYKKMKLDPEYNATKLHYFTSRIGIPDLEDTDGVDCLGPGAMNVIYTNFSPYLYPFIIEFCILIVGIFYMIFANINKCPKRVSALGHDHSHDVYDMAETIPGSGMVHDHEDRGHGHTNGHVGSPPSEISEHCMNTVDHESEYKSNLVIYADCHAANRGLFAGMILIVATIVFIILFFIATNNYEQSIDLDVGILIDSIFEVSVLAILIVTTIAAYMQISKLDVNGHPMSHLDDVLLFIAIPAFFLETIFSMVPAIENGSGLNIAIIICQLVQIMIQTPFIIDGLRRCCNDKVLRKNKPGRELITFLTIANVSLWIYYTFSVKNADTGDERYEFYGDELWTILNHLSLPLIMFYRFHSSVCLVDIWRHAYEPGGH